MNRLYDIPHKLHIREKLEGEGVNLLLLYMTSLLLQEPPGV